VPFGAGVEWLALEDRFALYGGGIAFIGEPGERSPVQAVDPTIAVHGPFSADFKWVTLPGEEGHPILCTDGQAAVFRALWSFKGEPRTSEQVMGRAQLADQKPIDVCKGNKHAEPLRAYRTLVVTQQRAGLYSMPCAAVASLAPA
jgi:hypothetical protein